MKYFTYRTKEQKGFTLLLSISIISLLSIVAGAIITSYLNAKNTLDKWEITLQALNYASEGAELAKWYMITQTNLDRISGWRNKIAPLSGKYRIDYSKSSGYLAVPADNEVIEVMNPKYRKFIRTIDISSPTTTDEKDITVTIDTGDSKKIQITTTHANVYGK
jgi:type II secretory pathway pseudopilin PulG